MIKLGWGREDPVFRRVSTFSFIPETSEGQMWWFDELQRRSMSAGAALASSLALLGVTSSARKVRTRTLILHADGDLAVPFEPGRRLAGLIPEARFVPLHSQNHILLADEPAWPSFLVEVTAFVGAERSDGVRADLTIREV